MTTIFDVYDFLRTLADKSGKGYLSPEEAGQWMGVAQTGMFNDARTPGQLDNRTQDLLAPFANTTSFTSNSSGVFAREADYVQALRIVDDATGLEYIPMLFNEMRDALRSVLEPIASYPRYTESDAGFTIYPSATTTGTITYYRMPLQPVVGYDLAVYAATGEIVYDAATSVQLEVPNAYWPELIKRTVAYLGVNLSDADLFAFSQNPTA